MKMTPMGWQNKVEVLGSLKDPGIHPRLRSYVGVSFVIELNFYPNASVHSMAPEASSET
jgi:hypothetical protein